MILGKATVGALDEGGVERDEVHENALAEFLADELADDLDLGEDDFGIDKEFDGVVALLAMDVDGAGKVGRLVVVEPIVIGEPTAGIRDGDEIAAAGVVEPGFGEFGTVENALDAFSLGENGFNVLPQARVIEVDVGDLVIGDGEGATIAKFEDVAPQLFLDLEPAVLAKDAIEVNGAIDLGDAVFGEEDGLDAAFFEEPDEAANDFINGAEIFGDARIVRSPLLEVVVEVWEVDEVEVGGVFFLDPFGGVGDPLAGADAGARSPELGKGKVAEVGLDGIADVERAGSDVENLFAVGAIDGARGDGVIDGGIHVVPPKETGAGKVGVGVLEDLPEFRAGDEAVGLLPEEMLGAGPVIPAVGDDAVISRSFSGQVGGLDRRGDGGEHRLDVRPLAALLKRGDLRHVGTEEPTGQAYDIENGNTGGFRHGWRTIDNVSP